MKLNIPVVILAGGLATRLKPITEKIPKSLVSVAGKPILTHQLELLKTQNIDEVILCVGHLGEMIQEKYGSEFQGIKIQYSFDGEKQLGTGGAIKKVMPFIKGDFFVLYGDSYLLVNFKSVYEHCIRNGAIAVMTVYNNKNQIELSNIVYENGMIVKYDKKNRVPEMQHIDYGLSLYNKSVFDLYPDKSHFDLSEVIINLVENKNLLAYEVKDRFYEMGDYKGLADLEALLGGYIINPDDLASSKNILTVSKE